MKAALTAKRNVFLGLAAAIVMADAAVVNLVAIDALSHHQDRRALVVAIAGFAALVALSATTGAIWRPGTLRQLVLITAGGAFCVAIASFVAWDPNAGSKTCPGRTDCDHGYGIGAMFVAMAVFGPMLASALLGRLLRLGSIKR